MLNDEAFRIFLANTRFPDIMRNDVRAIMAAAQLGERRVVELCQRFGRQTVTDAFYALREQTARYVRRAVTSIIPEGSYSFAEALDNDGVTGRPAWIRLTLTHEDGRLSLDARDSDDQTRGPANFLMHAVFLTVRLLDGFETNRESVSDGLLELMRTAGFAGVAKTVVINTPIGSIGIYRATKTT